MPSVPSAMQKVMPPSPASTPRREIWSLSMLIVMTQLSAAEGKTVVTIEGLSPNSSHPLQKAWVLEEVPQCGYCQSGQIMKAAELLASNPKPNRAQIVAHMDGNICRCGTYHRIIAAIERASKEA